MVLLMDMAKPMLLSLLAIFALATTFVHSQVVVDQTGYISIDCGASEDYTDANGLNYVPDTTYRETGITGMISPTYKITNLAPQLTTVRSFPNGTRNCYTVKPSLTTSTKYLIRARFMYANYDGKNDMPSFDVYLGANLWGKVTIKDIGISVTMEIITNVTTYTQVCLANTGQGTPVISALEFRPIKATNYAPKYGALKMFVRFDFGSYASTVVRYNDDIMDRIWVPFSWPELDYINTTLTVDATGKNEYNPPSVVMSTAVTPRNATSPIRFSFEPEDRTTEYYIYMYIAEVQKLAEGEIREFTIKLNGSLWLREPVRPDYLFSTTVYSVNPKSFDTFIFELEPTSNSTLPPLLNGLEIYEVAQLLQAPTGEDEVDAMKSMKSLYGVKRNWQGDPCVPQIYTWEGLNCSFTDNDPPIITTLNLSSSGLTGEIPSYIGDLKSLQILDLSNNNLNGSLPGFLTQLTSLTVLNLSKNNLSGTVPSSLTDKSSNGLLKLSVDGNVELCKSSTSCTTTPSGDNSGDNKKEKKSSSAVVPIIASVAGVAIVIILVALVICLIKKKKSKGGGGQVVSSNMTNIKSGEEESILEVKNRQISYAQVQSMTNNFETVVGEGGFGTVYLGYFNGAQVAVKMLSPSSAQGYKEFHAEVKLLMRVHHRNLTSLVAYCDDSDYKALVYEYMVQGNLADHLSERSTNVLSWEERLRIGMDSAQGLEYLHNGCKPPIVHRDVKTTNILLNETFQAKIADFGLSRGIPAEGGDNKSTVVAGTPGYLDPEYYISNKLMEKSDVFSFGVVILEIITGRAVITRNHETPHISKWTSNILEKEGDIKKIIDSRLHGDFDVNSAWKAVEVAMACVSPTSARRPTMTEVVMELKECLDMELARTNMNSRANFSSNSIDMAALNIDHSGMTPLAR